MSSGFRSLPPFTLNHCFGKNAWIGRGDDGALRGSTGREFPFHRQSQKRFPKERRKACGPALNHGKTTALWFREARHCPRAPPGAPKYLIPLVSCKSDGGQGFRSPPPSEPPESAGRGECRCAGAKPASSLLQPSAVLLELIGAIPPASGSLLQSSGN